MSMNPQLEIQAQAKQSTIQQNYDAKKYICGGWLGATGGPWNLVFKPAWEEALRKQGDNFASYYDYLIPENDHGGANGPAHPAGAGLAAVNFQSISARTVRTQKVYGLILTHIGYETHIKEKIEAHVANVLTGAPTAAAVVAANAAIAAALAAGIAVPGPAAGAAGQLPDDWVPQLYRWCNATLAQPRPSPLLTSSQNSQFENFKLTDVGIHRDTMSVAYSALVRLNNQRTVPFGPTDLYIKFLKQITFPKQLAEDAVRELQRPSYIFAGGVNAGAPDLGTLVQNFEELWHYIYDQGKEIKPQAPPKMMPERSNKVDGMMNVVTPFSPPENTEEISSSQAAQYNWSGLSQAEMHEAHFVSSAGGEAFAFLKNERNCWVCKGYGHMKEDCPSSQKVRRSYAACIQGLQTLKSNEDDRLRNFKQRRIIRRPGKSPKRPPSKALMNESTQMDDILVQYDDGGIYTTSGDEIVAPVEPLSARDTASEPVNAQSSAAEATVQPSATEAGPAQPTPAASQATPGATPNMTPNGGQVTFANVDSLIAQNYNSTVPSYNAEICSATDNDDLDNDPFVRDEHKWSTLKAGLMGALIATTGVLAAAAMATRSGRGRAILTLLAMASVGKGASTSGCANAKIHSSQFSRFNSYDAHTTSSGLPIDAQVCRDHGAVDTGSTECTSGRKKLFPNHLIEEWHPNIKVEVASGVCLPVEFRGVMLMRVKPVGRSSAKKYLNIPVPHGLYVPKMPVTLVSTKALFRYCNIRTFFNDQLCFLLPDGTVVGFVETATNYTVLFDGDTTQVKATYMPNTTIWPWTETTKGAFDIGPLTPRASAEQVLFRSTLKNPVPLTWDLCHERLCHFSPERIWASAEYIQGLNITPLRAPQRHTEPCIHCVRGAFRGHRHLHRTSSKFTRFAQRIYCDSCAMPKSTPFGYVEMYIFYDACTKYIAVYFGKTTQAWEMLLAFQQFIADHKRWMPRGHVEEWYADGGPEFKTVETELFCAEMHTRRRFIAPWNPWMNVAETGWRIILRPLRILLAASNVTAAFWPFAVNQIVLVHNSLSSSSDTSNITDSSTHAAFAFVASLSSRRSPPSPYFNMTGKPSNLENLRVLFCEMEVKVRNPNDLRQRTKVDPVTYRAINLGPSQRIAGSMVYIFDVQRFTVVSYNDCYFREHVRPRLGTIVGTFSILGNVGSLPTAEQQQADAGDNLPPELADVRTQPAPPPSPNVQQNAPDEPARNPNHGDDSAFRENHCSTPNCEFNAGHDGPCSTVIDAARRPRRPDLTHRDASRPARNVANVVAAMEGDSTGILAAPTDHHAFAVAIAGDGDGEVLVCYNIDAPSSDGPPKGTHEALNGPFAKEWYEAYQKDLTAKIKNGTFTYVSRPVHCKVVKTKVAHAHKRDDLLDAQIITERRARWVGMGFMQGPGDFNATYCATPTACSVRFFLTMVLALNMELAKGDVTKAFTLNPIDVEMYVEQMPGTEVAGDWKGATKENTVCLLHKCLEGLKQAGNVWQTTHSSFLDALALLNGLCVLVQSIVEPTLFIGHCSKGIIAILVWVDDLLIGFTCAGLYDDFVLRYKERFPSKHELGCKRFAGLNIDYKPGVSLTIHQRHHIESAHDKFVTDKAAAARSSYALRPAVSDRNSPFHYSRLQHAANDTERAIMKTKPFLAALATVMYTTYWTNPHLSYHTSFLGQFMHDPSPACMDAILGVLIYQYHHRDVDIIVYGGSLHVPRVIPDKRRDDFLAGHGFHGYCDASWLLRSPAAFLVFLCNGPIDWSSKLIRVICHSSAEAEIGAGCMLGKRIVFIVQLASEFKVSLKTPALTLIDNTATDDLCGKFGVTPKTAHFLRWQHYLRWLVIHRWAEIVFVPTKEQLADVLTKVVDYSTFVLACNILFKRRNLRASS